VCVPAQLAHWISTHSQVITPLVAVTPLLSSPLLSSLLLSSLLFSSLLLSSPLPSSG